MCNVSLDKWQQAPPTFSVLLFHYILELTPKEYIEIHTNIPGSFSDIRVILHRVDLPEFS